MSRILVVDDDVGIRESLALILSDTYEVTVATDGVEALALLQASHFDVVLLDLMMPVLDGAGLKRELDKRGIRVPVIMTSAGMRLHDYAMKLGAADYLAKPFDLSALEAKIAHVIAAGPAAGPAG